MFFATHCKRRIFLFETCCIICHYYWKRTAFQHLVYIRFLYVCSILFIIHFLEVFISPHSGHLPAVMRYRGTHFEEVFPRARYNQRSNYFSSAPIVPRRVRWFLGPRAVARGGSTHQKGPSQPGSRVASSYQVPTKIGPTRVTQSSRYIVVHQLLVGAL